MKNIILLILLLYLPTVSHAEILTVGNDGDGYDYSLLSQAAGAAQPGDTIMIYGDPYNGGEYVENLKGTPDRWITIMSGTGEKILYQGGNSGIHFVNIENVRIRDLAFEGQTGNGVNIDDGGDYSTPAQNIVIENCEWRSMGASGNNDELKMSGVDYFTIRNCSFKNGSAGGSLIDMVGCHDGVIEGNTFENGGSNSIQAKGGSEHVTIRGNFFKNGGLRSINIGGSTGEDYFRPLGASFESAHIFVHSNIFFGSQAPIAFVGTVESRVVNNTIVLPNKWAVRILQENTNEGIEQCGDNDFVNNIVFIDGAAASPTFNIGPNTRPESFYFANNLWYHFLSADWTGPNLPTSEFNGIIGEDPLFENFSQDNFNLSPNSPAIGNGMVLSEKILDYNGNAFNDPPSIGAIEGNPPTGVEFFPHKSPSNLKIVPNPVSGSAEIIFDNEKAGDLRVRLVDAAGRLMAVLYDGDMSAGEQSLGVDFGAYGLANGVYFVMAGDMVGIVVYR